MSEIITNAMIIDEKDTVAVAIEPVKAGQAAAWLDKTGGLHEVTAVMDIPFTTNSQSGICKRENRLSSMGNISGWLPGISRQESMYIHTMLRTTGNNYKRGLTQWIRK